MTAASLDGCCTIAEGRCEAPRQSGESVKPYHDIMERDMNDAPILKVWALKVWCPAQYVTVGSIVLFCVAPSNWFSVESSNLEVGFGFSTGLRRK